MTRSPSLPAGTDVLGPFCAAGLLEPVDVHLAAAISRLAPDTRPGVVLGAAMASRAPRFGHVCLDVDRAATTIVAEGGAPTDLPWPAPDAWLAELATSPAVAPANVLRPGAGDARPLVLDGRRLYLERSWRDEQAVAQHLHALATRPSDHTLLGGAGADPIEAAALTAAALDHWFAGGPGEPADQPDRQREAAASMLTRALTVVAGGPGTGKTRTLARVLALLHDPRFGRPPRVALAAPTGKAAARLAEAVAAQLADAGVDPVAAAALLDDARPVTLHRLLGLGPTRRRPRQLDADLVIVDEASMISLSLMAELVRALPEHGRLVLVGDPDQLTSIEAGTVLADIVRSAAVGGGGPVTPCVITLERPFRFGAGSAIARLAAAVRAGDAAAVRSLVPAATVETTPEAGPPADGVRLIDALDALVAIDGAGAAVRDLVLPAARRTWEAAAAGDAGGALHALSETRLLCAHRTGHHGVEAWNQEVERWLRDAEPGFDPVPRWHVGRPVLVTRNDPITGLANGDVGVVVRTDTGEVAVGVDQRGSLALLRPVQLPDVETFHAMTIHKSQGSEFERVVVILPPADSPLATRELLYTAITRGRHEVVLVGTTAALEASITRVVSRASGLAELLTTP